MPNRLVLDDRTAVAPSFDTLASVGLSTYRGCTHAQKRLVLHAYWSRRANESEQITRAAREYGPYALVMIGIITVELAIVSIALATDGDRWVWIAVMATAFSALATWWTEVCRRATTPRLPTVAHAVAASE